MIVLTHAEAYIFLALLFNAVAAAGLSLGILVGWGCFAQPQKQNIGWDRIIARRRER